MKFRRFALVIVVGLIATFCGDCRKTSDTVTSPGSTEGDASEGSTATLVVSSLSCPKQTPQTPCKPDVWTTTTSDNRRTHIAQTLFCSATCVADQLTAKFPECCEPYCTGLMYEENKLLTANHCGVPNYVRTKYYSYQTKFGTLMKLTKAKSYAPDFTVFETTPKHMLDGVGFQTLDHKDAFVKLGHDQGGFMRKAECSNTLASNKSDMFFHCCKSDKGGSGSPFFVGSTWKVAGMHSCGSDDQHNVGSRADVMAKYSPSICKASGLPKATCDAIVVPGSYPDFWNSLCESEPSEWCALQVNRAETYFGGIVAEP